MNNFELSKFANDLITNNPDILEELNWIISHCDNKENVNDSKKSRIEDIKYIIHNCFENNINKYLTTHKNILFSYFMGFARRNKLNINKNNQYIQDGIMLCNKE